MEHMNMLNIIMNRKISMIDQKSISKTHLAQKTGKIMDTTKIITNKLVKMKNTMSLTIDLKKCRVIRRTVIVTII